MKINPKSKFIKTEPSLIEEDDEQSGKPLCETLTDSMFSSEDTTKTNYGEAEDKNKSEG